MHSDAFIIKETWGVVFPIFPMHHFLIFFSWFFPLIFFWYILHRRDLGCFISDFGVRKCRVFFGQILKRNLECFISDSNLDFRTSEIGFRMSSCRSGLKRFLSACVCVCVCVFVCVCVCLCVCVCERVCVSGFKRFHSKRTMKCIFPDTTKRNNELHLSKYDELYLYWYSFHLKRNDELCLFRFQCPFRWRFQVASSWQWAAGSWVLGFKQV